MDKHAILKGLAKSGVTEYRFGADTEMRVDGAGVKRSIVGYAARFGVPSQPIMGMFVETIRKGAFKKTLKEADVRALFNHNQNFVLGRTSAKTLKLEEDSQGLRYTIQPPDTSFGNDLVESIDRGDIRESSFGFITIRDMWTKGKKDGDLPTRELIEVKLIDVSPVTFPAYEQTEVQVRSILDSFGIEKDRLAAALFKARAGLEMQEEEMRAVSTALDVLKVFDNAAPLDEHAGRSQEPAPASHSVPNAIETDPHASEARLRLLELAVG
jgi:hypothetical protein